MISKITGFCILLLSTLAFAQLKDSNRLIIPGKSLGSIKLGMSKKEIKIKFGLSGNTESATQWSYQGSGENFVRIVFNADKVNYIAFSSDQYKTAQGLMNSSSDESFKGFKKQVHSRPGPAEKMIRDVRYLMPEGGLAFYKYDIENIEPDQRDLTSAGIVFKGKFPPEDSSDWK